MIFFERPKLEQVVCYATDSRLMGVVGASIEYSVDDERIVELFHIDFELYGIDRFERFVGSDAHAVKEMKKEIFGGLGAKLVRLSQDQFFQLIYEGATVSALASQKLIGADMASSDYTPSEETHQTLMDKICVPIINDYQAIHYTIMRLTGQDVSGAKWLSNIEVASFPSKGMLVRNQIDVLEPGIYRATAVIATDKDYDLVTLRVHLGEGHRIDEMTDMESMPISDFEVALFVKKKEIISIFEILDPNFEQQFVLSHKHCLLNLHENGRVFTEFKATNDHVLGSHYLISDDVERVFFITDSGQLLVMSYDEQRLEAFEQVEVQRYLGQLEFMDTIHFEDPILYDFVDSPYDDFIDFLESL